MGDLAELRGLITVIAFFSCFVILVAVIPGAFLYASPEYRQVETPEYFEAIDLQYFTATKNFTVTQNLVYYFNLGGWNIRFISSSIWQAISCNTYSSWWVFEWNQDNFKWYDKNGIDKTYQLGAGRLLNWYELDNNWNNEKKENKWILKNSKTQLTVFFGWNQTKYSKPSDALLNNELYILFGIGMDSIATVMNAWNLIGMLLFFQMPQIHPVINALIAIPIWVCIAYLIYVLILKAIPFVGD